MQIKNRNMIFANQDSIVWEGRYAILCKNGTDSFGKDCYKILILDETGNWTRYCDYGSGLFHLRDMASKNDIQTELVHQCLPDIETVAKKIKTGEISYHIAEVVIKNSYFSENGHYIVKGTNGYV